MGKLEDFKRAVRDVDDIKALVIAMETDPLHSTFLVKYKEMVHRYNQQAEIVKALGKNLEFEGKVLPITEGQINIRITKCEVSKYDAAALLSEFPEALEIDGLVSVTDKGISDAISNGKLSPAAIKHKIRRRDLDYVTVKGVQEIKI